MNYDDDDDNLFIEMNAAVLNIVLRLLRRFIPSRIIQVFRTQTETELDQKRLNLEF